MILHPLGFWCGYGPELNRSRSRLNFELLDLKSLRTGIKKLEVQRYKNQLAISNGGAKKNYLGVAAPPPQVRAN